MLVAAYAEALVDAGADITRADLRKQACEDNPE